MVKAGYKQTEVGEIPEDWEIEPLSKDVNLISGHHILADYCNKSGLGTPYLTGPADFPDGRITQTKFTTRPAALCDTGDLLITVKGSGAGTIVEADSVYCISRQLMAIRAKKWNKKFLYYSILQNASQIQAASAGLIPGLSRHDILDQEIPLPNDEDEQKAIADALSHVDSLIAWLEKLIEKKRDIKTATMQQLLTGKRRLPGFGEGKGKKQTQLGEIPEDWDAARIGDNFDFKNGLNKAKQYFGHGTPIVNYMDVFSNYGIGASQIQGKVDVSRDEINNYSAKKGDVFFTRTSETVDEIGIAAALVEDVPNTVFSGFVLRAREKDGSKCLSLEFKKYCFHSEVVRKQVRSTSSYTTRALTNGKLLSEVRFPRPRDIREQEEIARAISNMESEISAIEKRLHKTKAIKQGMMQELLTGRTRLV